MIADKKTLMVIKDYLENRSGWDLEELISTVAFDTELLNHNDIKRTLEKFIILKVKNMGKIKLDLLQRIAQEL